MPLKLTEEAIKIIESYPDSFWDWEPTFSGKSFYSGASSSYHFPSTLRDKLTELQSSFRNENGHRDWDAYVREREYIRKAWNSCRRKAHKRSGMDKKLKKAKEQKQQAKIQDFEYYRDDSQRIVRELVPELLALDHLLGQETISRAKIQKVQLKLSILWNKQKQMLRSGKGTKRLLK